MIITQRNCKRIYDSQQLLFFLRKDKQMKSKGMLFFKIVTAVLLVMALFVPDQNRNLFLGIIAFGLIGTVFLALAPRIQLPKLPRCTKRIRRAKSPDKPPFDDIRSALLCQLSHRVTDKLRSAYPDATWDWEKRPSTERLLNGKAVRICVTHAGEFTHAEINIDAYGSLRLKMMRIQPLSQTGQSPDETPAPEPPVVDCSSWYELIGANVLSHLITDLNARGYSTLSINEGGEIIIVENEKPVVKDTFQNFPGKNYWEELVSIFADNELKAEITDTALQISWGN